MNILDNIIFGGTIKFLGLYEVLIWIKQEEIRDLLISPIILYLVILGNS